MPTAKGLFAPELVVEGWFDETQQIKGWFDETLLDSAATGDIVGASTLTFTPTGAVTSAGQTGATTLTFAPAGTISGVTQTGATTLTFAPTATLTSASQTGATSLTFAPTGALNGGLITGSTSLAFAPAATLTSPSQTGATTLTFTPTGTITSGASGDITGASSLTFTPTGVLTGTAAPVVEDAFDYHDGSPSKDRTNQQRDLFRQDQERLQQTIRKAVDTAFGNVPREAPLTKAQQKQVIRTARETIRLDGVQQSLASIEHALNDYLAAQDEQQAFEADNQAAMALIFALAA